MKLSNAKVLKEVSDSKRSDQQFCGKSRVARRVPLVEQELLTFPEYLSSPPVLVGFVLLEKIALCAMF